jgi:hypothetical protein
LTLLRVYSYRRVCRICFADAKAALLSLDDLGDGCPSKKHPLSEGDESGCVASISLRRANQIGPRGTLSMNQSIVRSTLLALLLILPAQAQSAEKKGWKIE